ncbi:hypothetical protein [Streptomyces sp. YIM S03343]
MARDAGDDGWNEVAAMPATSPITRTSPTSPTTEDPVAVLPVMHAPARPAGEERRRRRTVKLLALSVLGLIPWTVLMALTLPSDYRVHQWRAAWVGFDILLLTAAGATAVLARRRHAGAVLAALATAVLLVCDAWFDVSLDFGTPAVWASAALAVFVELPVAAFLVHRAHTLLRQHWAPVRQPGR